MSMPFGIKQVLTTEFPRYYEHNKAQNEYSLFILNQNTIAVWGTALFSFICQMVVMPVISEMKNPTEKRCKLIFKCSVCCEIALFILMASVGYLSFGEATPAIITSRKPLPNSKDRAMFIGQLCLFFTLNMGVPIRLNAARRVMLSSYKALGLRENLFIYSIFTLFMLSVPTFISIIFEDIQAIFSILGGSIGTLIMVFWPGSFP
jgi:amino acid permease